jgi:hypothetical protein
MREIFIDIDGFGDVDGFEELERLQYEYNLEDYGMSGQHHGWNWLQDDEAGVAVYLRT